jgi:hypothetical protein
VQALELRTAVLFGFHSVGHVQAMTLLVFVAGVRFLFIIIFTTNVSYMARFSTVVTFWTFLSLLGEPLPHHPFHQRPLDIYVSIPGATNAQTVKSSICFKSSNKHNVKIWYW